MPPTPCPQRLRKLIESVNKQSTDELDVLRKILHAIQNKRQGKGTDTYAVNLVCTVTINLIDYSFNIRNELALALEEIDPPERIDRIRECVVCNRLFWAGSADKRACDEHVGRWRKSQNRRDIKQREFEAAAQRRTEEAKKTLGGMSGTALSVIRVIMQGVRLFGSIDVESSHELWDSGEVIRSTRVVRLTINKLVKDGYLRYSESAEPRNDRYEPTQKLIDLWKMTREPTTH